MVAHRSGGGVIDRSIGGGGFQPPPFQRRRLTVVSVPAVPREVTRCARRDKLGRYSDGACTRVDEAEVMAEAAASVERLLSRLDLDLSILRRA